MFDEIDTSMIVQVTVIDCFQSVSTIYTVVHMVYIIV